MMDQPMSSRTLLDTGQVTLIRSETTPSRRGGSTTSEQRFLLLFIFGNYFGPDVRTEIPRKSAMQRVALHIPPYTPDLLGGSVFKLSEIESVYYYILRNSDPCARVKLQSLYKFLHGHLTSPFKETLVDNRQFPSFFPPDLHRQSRYKGTYKVVESIVFIDAPDLSHMSIEDVIRFKLLSGMDTLDVEKEEAMNYQHGLRTDRDEERQARFERSMHFVKGPKLELAAEMGNEAKRQRKESTEVITPPVPSPEVENSHCIPCDKLGSLLFLPGLPSSERDVMADAPKSIVAVTGTAAARQGVPLIGLVDIGICDDAYLFRTALPGVKRDDGEFSCQVEFDGKVTITGSTTTGKSQVINGNRVFTMLTHSLTPPGPFTVSFHLPGPVEPSNFTGTFGSDGILEGIVMKQTPISGAAALTFEN